MGCRFYLYYMLQAPGHKGKNSIQAFLSALASETYTEYGFSKNHHPVNAPSRCPPFQANTRITDLQLQEMITPQGHEATSDRFEGRSTGHRMPPAFHPSQTANLAMAEHRRPGRVLARGCWEGVMRLKARIAQLQGQKGVHLSTLCFCRQ